MIRQRTFRCLAGSVMKNIMECLHIIPSKGLSGFFYLEMSLCKAIKKLRTFGVKLPDIQIIEEVRTKRLVVDVKEARLKLVFDELYQVLIIIEIDLRDNEKPRIPIMFQLGLYTEYSQLGKCFNLPGDLIEFPGSFEVHQFQGYSVLVRSSNPEKIFIHKKSVLPIKDSFVKTRLYEIHQGQYVTIKHTTGKSEDIPWNLFPESVIDLMGTPDSVKPLPDSLDYFYVYKSEGIDLLFEGGRNVLKEIIMQTNMPESIEFNEYDRCHYLMYLESGTVTPLSKFSEFRELLPGPVQEIYQKRHTHGYKPTTFYRSGMVTFEVLSTGFIANLSVRNYK